MKRLTDQRTEMSTASCAPRERRFPSRQTTQERVQNRPNGSVVDPKALPPSTEKVACKDHELVTVLDKQVKPERTTSLSIILVKMATEIDEVLILLLPLTMNLLLGSDWRSLSNVDVTCYVSNDVTLISLHTQVATKQVGDSVSPLKPPRTREALISTSTARIPHQAKENTTMFVSLKPTTSGPDRDLERKNRPRSNW
ncbi:hypothetical protein MTO96_020870 [Rhipicephalus appendiculatus]